MPDRGAGEKMKNLLAVKLKVDLTYLTKTSFNLK